MKDAAGLSHCSAHGLGHAAARRLADAGATPHEIASITGHVALGRSAVTRVMLIIKNWLPQRCRRSTGERESGSPSGKVSQLGRKSLIYQCDFLKVQFPSGIAPQAGPYSRA